jgi:hypothetical protein
MKFFFLAISFLTLTSSSSAADYENLNQWKDTTNADTTRIKALNEYIWRSLLYSSPDSAIYYAYDLQKLTVSMGDSSLIAVVYNTIGSSYYFIGDFGQIDDVCVFGMKIK